LAAKSWDTGQPQQIEVEYREKWYDRTWAPLSADSYLHYSIDITERKQAEEALRLSESFLNSIIEQSPTAMWISDSVGKLVRLNQACRDLLRISDEEVIGKYNVLEDNIVQEQGFLSLVRRVFDAGETARFEIEYDSSRLKQPELAHTASVVVEVTAFPIMDAAGRVTNAVVQNVDITERKKAEEALRLTQFSVDRAADLIHWLDPEGRILFANEASCRRDGYSVEEMLSMTIFDLDPNLTPELWRAWWSDLKQAGSLTIESLHRNKLGETYPVEVSANYMELGGKEYNCVFARDITERKKADEALRLSEERLRQSQKMEAVGQLAGGIAHDFNNLLTVIIGEGSLALATMSPTDPHRELVADMTEAGERAAGLTRQILAFSRRQILKPEVVVLNEIALGMEPLLRRTLGEDINLSFSLAPDLARTEVDPHQVEQVLMNLALNSRDAMPSGGSLTVQTSNVELDPPHSWEHPGVKPGSYVILAVSDTGWGMDEETKSHIFEPFFTTKDVGKGTGLGLSTVLGIIDQSGGTLAVESEPGLGTTFRVFLPVASPGAGRARSSPRETEGGRGTETILVVEDEPSVRELVAKILARAGYEVVEAGSMQGVDEALGKASNTPHLLLTDLVLPGGANGKVVAETLLQRQPGLKVIYMSGYARDSVVHNGRLDEGIEFMEKPFSAETLLLKVRQALDGGASTG